MGSVTEEGEFIVMRFNRMTTTIKAPQFMIVCQCGFGTLIVNSAGPAQLIYNG